MSSADGQQIKFGKASRLIVQTNVPMKTERDSANVRSTTISEYKWECRLYDGDLIAVHGDYVAYVLNSKC